MKAFRETSIAAIFQNQALKYGNNKACVAYKKGMDYKDISWQEMNRMVRNLGCYLLSININKGDRIAIYSRNRYEWWVADLAALSIGAICVSVHATNSTEETFYILEHSGASVCFVGGNDLFKKVQSVSSNLPDLRQIICFDEKNGVNNCINSFNEVLNIGNSSGNTDLFESRIMEVSLQDCAALIYTSGTTGNPKGVMLTNENFISNVNQLYGEIKEYLSDSDEFLSILPLSHSLERTCGYYVPLIFGCKVFIAGGINTIIRDFTMVRPTILVSVPRFYEKLHSGILAKIRDAGIIKKAFINFALCAGKINLRYICNSKKRTGLFRLIYGLAEKLVFVRVKRLLGLDRLRVAISGAGPLSKFDANFFLGMDLILLEGYGLTETSPVTNCNPPRLIKPGTVGISLPGTEVKISYEGEILIRGPQVMKGYYRDDEATRKAFTSDGFFKTGDMGVIDSDGYLSITGRLKDIIINSGGKNISPQNIENSLKESCFIENVAIIGDKRKYLSAIIIPSFEELKKWAEKNNIDFTDNKDLISDEKIIRLFRQEITRLTKQFSQYEQIKKFRLLAEIWSQETGEITSSFKIKRRVIESKYKKVIEGMYP